MLYIIMFLGIVLSIVKANGWFVVPTFVLAFCWVMTFFGWVIYNYAKGLSDGINKKMNEQVVSLTKELEEYKNK